VGWLERNLYKVNESKFQTNLVPAYSNASVVIYEVPDQILDISLVQ
jgi:uncharacterized membrane protein